MAAILSRLGACPEQEVVIKEGYSIDVLILWNGERVAIEVDGPTHFLWRQLGEDCPANGATLLKRRQLKALGLPLVTVPYQKWDKLTCVEAKCEYLLHILQSLQVEGTEKKQAMLQALAEI